MSSAPQFKLYHYWRSSCSWRVRWALHLKNIPYTDVIVDLLKGEQKRPDFLAVNPQGFLPVLDTGEAVLGESMAILEWIEENFPSPALLPQNSIERAMVRQFSLGIVAGTQPLQNLAVIRLARNDEKEQQAFARHWIQRGLEKMEKLILQWRCSGTYTFGGQITFADLCLVPQLYNAERFGCDFSEFPALAQIGRRCLETPECYKAHPDQQPGH